jgi:peroxiredoxin Q/BCP
VGDKIYKFFFKDGNGVMRGNESVLGKKPVVIYFIKEDDTAGCTRRLVVLEILISLQDPRDEVMGISSDSEIRIKNLQI